jgi:hypothetical protein
VWYAHALSGHAGEYGRSPGGLAAGDKADCLRGDVGAVGAVCAVVVDCVAIMAAGGHARHNLAATAVLVVFVPAEVAQHR